MIESKRQDRTTKLSKTKQSFTNGLKMVKYYTVPCNKIQTKVVLLNELALKINVQFLATSSVENKRLTSSDISKSYTQIPFILRIEGRI